MYEVIDGQEQSREVNAIFSLTVDFNRYGYCRYGKLKRFKAYSFNDTISEQSSTKITYEKLKDFIVNTIKHELRPIFLAGTDCPVRSVDVIETYEGSILVLFKVAFNALQFIGGFKDLYDSIKLIKHLTNVHIKQRLNENYGQYFKVDTKVLTYQSGFLKSDEDLQALTVKKKLNIQTTEKRRDGFFYYLLISNIVLICLLIALVFKAVVNTYF